MQITLIKPDDYHIHLRDNAFLKRTVADAAKQFARAIVMPNLTPPVTNVTAAATYRTKILTSCPSHYHFDPLMTLYLTDTTSIDTIKEAKHCGFIYGCKLYPAGATTNSDAGVTAIQKIYPVLEKMAEEGMPLLIHGEVTGTDVDVFDREKIFIDQILMPICEKYPSLKIVLEHITTRDAVQFVLEANTNVAATITAHHLLLNRNDIFIGGIQPHHYCLPILKRQNHQEELIKAATSGNPKFFLGSDSAPHPVFRKESTCGCAGIYTAYSAIELYAEVFELAGKLDKLEAFASFYGADFYGLPHNKEHITLIKEDWVVPEELEFGDTKLKPFRAGQLVKWKIKD